MKKTIYWLRNDLRLSDNSALNFAALQQSQIIFLYILDENEKIGGASKWFLHQALSSLQKDLKNNYNANLVFKKGDPKQILQKLVTKYEIDSIVWNRVYEPKNIKRDKEIKSNFQNLGLKIESFNSSLLFEPWEIKNLSGEYFKVFTPFWKKCLSLADKISNPLIQPESLRILPLQGEEKFDLNDLNLLPKNPNWAKDWHKFWQVSENSAHEILQNFLQNKVSNYGEGRNFPAQNNTTKLSPYLHFGLISPKQIYHQTSIILRNKGVETFLSEIGWREFSYHLLYHFADLPQKNFKERFNKFSWENNLDDLQKWQKGQTGFPIIDAGMRELWQTGWMHNRVRMIVASFLIKNLLIDWRLGQEWFWDCLVDADLAANSASWQWVAGSGADAAPYFRIFNPILQSKKFDEQGNYIRKWLPELAKLDNEQIHFPANCDEKTLKNAGIELGKNYPKPMIDFAFSRNRALAIYKTL